jgi:ABC-type sugar transport system ATPase subunit
VVHADTVPQRQAAPPDADLGAPLLELVDVSRSFGETRALDSATLLVRPGEIHTLAGENGSGKSTLIKVLSGALRPDAGELRWLGEPTRFRNPASSQHAGITTVFQETLVIPELSVADNLFVGMDGMFARKHRSGTERAQARDLLDRLGLRQLDLDRLVWTLSLAEQQLVTIERALVRPWKLLVLDEGTSALDSEQRDGLFALLREHRQEGRSVLFTSHRMDEVQQLADAVTVLRLGSTAARFALAETSPREILSLMAGREAVAVTEGAEAGRAAARARPLGDVVLRVRDLRLQPDAQPVSLGVRRGEILGLAGLEGQGQERFAAAVSGLFSPGSGRVEIADDAGAWAPVRSFGEANRRGIAYVPRDRKREGLFFALSIQDNFSMAPMRTLNRAGLLRRRELSKEFQTYAAQLRLKSGAPRNLIGTLSGGNQQKVLLARWLATRPQVLVLNDPLRGVDANTKEELYELIRTLADGGMTIVLLSTEILELLMVCDRLAVFHDGGLSAEMPALGTAETDVVAAMFGHTGSGDE